MEFLPWSESYFYTGGGEGGGEPIIELGGPGINSLFLFIMHSKSLLKSHYITTTLTLVFWKIFFGFLETTGRWIIAKLMKETKKGLWDYRAFDDDNDEEDFGRCGGAGGFGEDKEGERCDVIG